MAVGAPKLVLPPRFPSPSPPPCRRRHPLRFPSSMGNRKPLLLPRPVSSSLVEAREGGGELLAFTDPEVRLVEGLLGLQGRGRSATPQQLKDVEKVVTALEDSKGVPEPRLFVGFDIFNIFQEVYLRTDDPRVSNIVQFSNAVGELKVEAEATIKDGKRILFRFDRAAFSFRFLPFMVPYPVPFRLLGNEAKGWLDTTYLSPTGNIRISRGSKGTTFVLQKKTDPRQRMLSAISTGSGIKEVIDELVILNQNRTFEESLLEGEWQLLWTSQMEGGGWSEAAAIGLKGLQIVRKNGRVENLVDVFPGFKLSACGCFTKSDESYSVTMSSGSIVVGAVKFPLGVKSSYSVHLLYIDKKIRITRGYKGIIFVHLCVNRPERLVT